MNVQKQRKKKVEILYSQSNEDQRKNKEKLNEEISKKGQIITFKII